MRWFWGDFRRLDVGADHHRSCLVDSQPTSIGRTSPVNDCYPLRYPIIRSEPLHADVLELSTVLEVTDEEEALGALSCRTCQLLLRRLWHGLVAWVDGTGAVPNGPAVEAYATQLCQTEVGWRLGGVVFVRNAAWVPGRTKIASASAWSCSALIQRLPFHPGSGDAPQGLGAAVQPHTPDAPDAGAIAARRRREPGAVPPHAEARPARHAARDPAGKDGVPCACAGAGAGRDKRGLAGPEESFTSALRR